MKKCNFNIYRNILIFKEISSKYFLEYLRNIGKVSMTFSVNFHFFLLSNILLHHFNAVLQFFSSPLNSQITQIPFQSIFLYLLFVFCVAHSYGMNSVEYLLGSTK